jgi:hypothetical protein
VEFLEAIDSETTYSFVRSSVAFVSQLGLVARAIGRGKVVSFMAPYRCETCDRETEHLLQTGSLSIPVGKAHPNPPPFQCSVCAEAETFDEMPDRYFAFMTASSN